MMWLVVGVIGAALPLAPTRGPPALSAWGWSRPRAAAARHRIDTALYSPCHPPRCQPSRVELNGSM